MDRKRDQVALEARLAQALLNATDAERRGLYGPAYDQIYAASLEGLGDTAEEQAFGASPAHVPLLKHVAPDGATALEIGCGTGLLSIELAKSGLNLTGVDVSRVAIDRANEHGGDRATFTQIEGIALPFGDDTFDFAFSVEVLEHLHKRDALPHLSEVARVLRAGSAYVIATPNREYSSGVKGRWGVDADADVHLWEWNFRELDEAMRSAGFQDVRYLWRLPKVGRYSVPPARIAAAIERRLRNPRLAELAGVNHCRIVGRLSV